jgi:lysozyme
MIFNDCGVSGPDVSFYQDAPTTARQIDFEKMKAAGASFVIIKAGQRDYADPDFLYNWREAKRVGIPRGSYWFYDSREDPKKQAEKWWSLLESDPGELVHALDLEENYNGPWRDWSYWYDFLYRFQTLSGLVNQYLPIYTGFYYWTEHAPTNAASRDWFKRYPLWLANYNPQAEVRVPAPWTECLLWQYGTPVVGIRYGAESLEIDMNLFNGNLETFNAYFGLTETLPPSDEEPTGETMQGKVLKLTNVRALKTQFSSDMGDLLAGDIVQWSEEGTGTDGLVWMTLTSATRNGVPVLCTDGNTVAGRYCWANNVEEIVPPVTPPPAELPNRIGLTLDGTTIKWYVAE